MRIVSCILHAVVASNMIEAAQIRGASSLSSSNYRTPIEIDYKTSGSVYQRRRVEFEKDSSFISDYSRVVDGSEVVEEDDQNDQSEEESGEKGYPKTKYPKGLANVSPNEANSYEDSYGSDGDEEIYEKEDDEEIEESDSEDEDKIIPDEYRPNITLPGKKDDKKSKAFGKGSSTPNKKGGKKDKKPKLEDPKDAQKMSKYEILPKGMKRRE
ncbi:hypothetical protein IV203_021837 [Nitzschia inconspicua]|uniref:Uncharacterized protein n=1 Tax=Nitzschia inconspicua TaxID=303405 RepID=A0A9K3PGA2_9STRA|nr:hypothetical protein IV203_033457 [Nitzschia inconspicua]KAG7343829.1 hypothetical protein IV203_021837 [Nitzschia inconspicua]